MIEKVDTREPMSPEEFDAACRALWRRVPGLSETGGRRSKLRNKRVNGHELSKHRIGMARDFAADQESDLKHGAAVARILGLWVDVHDVGSGKHIHCQGLPPGEIDEAWRVRYLEDDEL